MGMKVVEKDDRLDEDRDGSVGRWEKPNCPASEQEDYLERDSA